MKTPQFTHLSKTLRAPLLKSFDARLQKEMGKLLAAFHESVGDTEEKRHTVRIFVHAFSKSLKEIENVAALIQATSGWFDHRIPLFSFGSQNANELKPCRACASLSNDLETQMESAAAQQFKIMARSMARATNTSESFSRNSGLLKLVPPDYELTIRQYLFDTGSDIKPRSVHLLSLLNSEGAHTPDVRIEKVACPSCLGWGTLGRL